MRQGRATFRTSPRLVALVALALLVKALVPVGWMPVLAKGEITLRLCGGQVRALHVPSGAHRHHMARSHHEGVHAEHHGQGSETPAAEQPCPFTIAGQAWAAPEAVLAAAPVAAVPVAPLVLVAVAVGRGLAAPPPRSTGPPPFP